VSAVTTALSFQPAVGVSVCITSVSAYNAWVRINDSAAGTTALCAGMGALGAGTNMNTKMMITNSVYLYIDSTSGQSTHYTGIQIA